MIQNTSLQGTRQINDLPIAERISLVERIRVVYPRWTAILEEIERCHTMNVLAAEPQCLLLIGPTGAGKSSLVESYSQKFPAFRNQEGKVIKVLKATIPSPASERNLLTTLLHALGDPLAGLGSIGIMTIRLINLIKACGVEMLILDELQHFVDRESKKVLQNASNWLKTVIKETKVATVLVGLKDEAEQVVDVNPQLARLFGDPVKLNPFQWDAEDGNTVTEFRSFLKILENLLPLKMPSNLADKSNAEKIYQASNGLVSYLMALIRRAAFLALSQGIESINNDLLFLAFEQRLAGIRRKISNPFSQ